MNCGVWKAAADLVIDPDVNGFKYDDFERSDELIRAGEAATRAALPEIRKWLAQPETTRKAQVVATAHPAAVPAE
jgi:predicted acylesterase/phospholipase RssA